MPCEDTMQIQPPPSLPPSLREQLYKAPPRDSQIYRLQRGSLKASLMIPRDPQPQGPGQHLEEQSPFKWRSRCCTCMCFVRERCPPSPHPTPPPPTKNPPPLELTTHLFLALLKNRREITFRDGYTFSLHLVQRLLPRPGKIKAR